MIGKGHTRT